MCRVAVYLLITSTANAATFYGPAPYLSQADSPFNLSGLGTTFFLEDFEDGLINTPGLSVFNAEILLPGEFTDSVDLDDGMIDGSGSAGYSLIHAGPFINRPVFVRIMSFNFDKDDLGFLPTAFGFVWTDGASHSAEVGIRTWNVDGEIVIHSFLPELVNGIGDDDFDGGTTEDRFFGIRRDDGIMLADVVSVSEDSSLPFEIDHVQYGLFIPEPTMLALVCVLITSLALARNVAFRR